MSKVFILAHDQARAGVAAFAKTAPLGWWCVFSAPAKKRAQEQIYHCLIGEISQQATYCGKKWDAEDMKRICIDEFAEEMRLAGTPLHHDGRLIPSENGRRVIQLGIQSRDFRVAEASQFVEFLFAFGADRGVVFTDPRTPP